jgi:hypothetical protein
VGIQKQREGRSEGERRIREIERAREVVGGLRGLGGTVATVRFIKEAQKLGFTKR